MRRVESAGTHTRNLFENYADVQSRSSSWQFIGKIAPVRTLSLFELPPTVSFTMLACTRRNFRPWRRFTFTLRKELQHRLHFFFFVNHQSVSRPIRRKEWAQQAMFSCDQKRKRLQHRKEMRQEWWILCCELTLQLALYISRVMSQCLANSSYSAKLTFAYEVT